MTCYTSHMCKCKCIHVFGNAVDAYMAIGICVVTIGKLIRVKECVYMCLLCMCACMCLCVCGV